MYAAAFSAADFHGGSARQPTRAMGFSTMETSTRSNNILHRIVEARRLSIAHRKRVLPEVALKIAVEKKAKPTRDFADALAREGFNVIAELKKASPSRGIMRTEYAPAALAAILEQGGAAALSVLTEEDFF